MSFQIGQKVKIKQELKHELGQSLKNVNVDKPMTIVDFDFSFVLVKETNTPLKIYWLEPVPVEVKKEKVKQKSKGGSHGRSGKTKGS